MRNANLVDIEEFHNTGILKEDVMYVGPWGCRIHGKKQTGAVATVIENYIHDCMIVETAEGRLTIVHKDDIKAIPRKGPAQQSKRPRRKPVKGTRPEIKIPYAEYIAKYGKLKVGDTVLVDWVKGHEYYGVRRQKVERLSKYDSPRIDGYYFEEDGLMNLRSGSRITHVILPYKEEPTNTCVVTHEDIVKALSSEAFAKLVREEVKKILACGGKLP